MCYWLGHKYHSSLFKNKDNPVDCSNYWPIAAHHTQCKSSTRELHDVPKSLSTREVLSKVWALVSRMTILANSVCASISRKLSTFTIQVSGEGIVKKNSLCYLGSHMQSVRGINEIVYARINATWLQRKGITGVLCDTCMLIHRKSKVYKMVVHSPTRYGTKGWPATKVQSAFYMPQRCTCSVGHWAFPTWLA